MLTNQTFWGMNGVYFSSQHITGWNMLSQVKSRIVVPCRILEYVIRTPWRFKSFHPHHLNLEEPWNPGLFSLSAKAALLDYVTPAR